MSAIRAENFHTDDSNLSRIKALLPNGYSTLSSCIISKITFVRVKMVNSVNREITVDVFKLLFV